jgi:hypothetical protein
MANRISPAEVKEIIKIPTFIPDTVIHSFIVGANLTVTAILGSDTVITAAQLKEVEKWLAAHFLACSRVRQAQEQEVLGETSIKYTGTTDKGLDATFYGQTVKILDTTGKLDASIGKKQASMTAITSFE